MIWHDFKGENLYFVLFSDGIDNLLQFLHYDVYKDTFAVFRYPNEVIVAEIF